MIRLKVRETKYDKRSWLLVVGTVVVERMVVCVRCLGLGEQTLCSVVIDTVTRASLALLVTRSVLWISMCRML